MRIRGNTSLSTAWCSALIFFVCGDYDSGTSAAVATRTGRHTMGADYYSHVHTQSGDWAQAELLHTGLRRAVRGAAQLQDPPEGAGQGRGIKAEMSHLV